MKLTFDPNSIDDYKLFLKIKSFPLWFLRGREAIVPDEYAHLIGQSPSTHKEVPYTPLPCLFDYQEAIIRIAIRKRKFAVFAECGLGKTLIFLEFARHILNTDPNGHVLIVSPLMVVPQTIAEAQRFYGDGLPIQQAVAKNLSHYLLYGRGITITNYEALKTTTPAGRLTGIILDEASMLKSHYGRWAQKCLDLGRGVPWKMTCTGTPAPNDRIEYANQAVFLDRFPNVNSFLAAYFVNRGQTANRWELKPHATGAFYRELSHWCIFLTNPATYGWKDHSSDIPPIHVHIHDVPLTSEQEETVRSLTGQLFVVDTGGITRRIALGGIAKGLYQRKPISTNKPGFIRRLVESWPNESTIIWCLRDFEQQLLEGEFPAAASLYGKTPLHKRLEAIADFRAGRIKVLISKPRILGFGLNLQVATRQVFSGLQDSYEQYWQAVKRGNRVGSKHPLNVHIPITMIEEPMIQTVLTKAKRIQHDTDIQEKLFYGTGWKYLSGVG